MQYFSELTHTTSTHAHVSLSPLTRQQPKTKDKPRRGEKEGRMNVSFDCRFHLPALHASTATVISPALMKKKDLTNPSKDDDDDDEIAAAERRRRGVAANEGSALANSRLPPHVQQVFSWDCGIAAVATCLGTHTSSTSACSMNDDDDDDDNDVYHAVYDKWQNMCEDLRSVICETATAGDIDNDAVDAALLKELLKGLSSNNVRQASSSRLITSVWTIDLYVLLHCLLASRKNNKSNNKKNSSRLYFSSVQPGVDPSYQSMHFYSGAFSQDEARVPLMFELATGVLRLPVLRRHWTQRELIDVLIGKRRVRDVLAPLLPPETRSEDDESEILRSDSRSSKGSGGGVLIIMLVDDSKLRCTCTSPAKVFLDGCCVCFRQYCMCCCGKPREGCGSKTDPLHSLQSIEEGLERRDENEAEQRHQEQQQHQQQGLYLGHYICVFAFDAQRRLFYYRNPNAKEPGAVCCASPEVLDSARRQRGTDEDMIIVEFN